MIRHLLVAVPLQRSRSYVIPQEAEGHANTRVVWLGNSDYILSSGHGSNRERQVTLRDIRNLANPLKEYSGDSSLGIYLPLFDTGMLARFLMFAKKTKNDLSLHILHMRC